MSATNNPSSPRSNPFMRLLRFLENWQQLISMVVPLFLISLVWFFRQPYWKWFRAHPLELFGICGVLSLSGFLIWRFLRKGLGNAKDVNYFLITASVLTIAYLAFMPLRFPIPDTTYDASVKIVGSTTLGKDWMPRHIERIAHRNHASRIVTTFQDSAQNSPTSAPSRGTASTVDVAFQADNLYNQEFEDLTKVQFEITSQGSGTVVDALNAEPPKAYLGMASRQLENAENLDAYPIGKDAIAIILNSDNSDVNDLTEQELQSIFETGHARGIQWRVCRRPNSGTTSFLMNSLKIDSNSQRIAPSCSPVSNLDMIEQVASIPHSIGYVSSSFTTNSTHHVHVASIRSDTGYSELPSWESIINNRYPIVRDLYLYTPREIPGNSREAKLALFIARQAASSNFGDDVTRSSGFVPTSDMRYAEAQRSEEQTPSYASLVSVNNVEDFYGEQLINSPPKYVVEFASGNTPTEAEASKLEKWLEETSLPEPLVLFGHADLGGDDNYNDGLSMNRSKQVESLIRQVRGDGTPQLLTYGFGSRYPSETGSSRRVEIYFLSDMQEYLSS